jgi:hypothetical protein
MRERERERERDEHQKELRYIFFLLLIGFSMWIMRKVEGEVKWLCCYLRDGAHY